jgi:hypothetical protein
LGLSVLLAGCAGAAGTAGRNVRGRSARWEDSHGMNDVSAAMRAATAHCAQFNKKAMLTQMQTQKEGGLVAFECL